ncbi:MAG: hypothetical protein QOK39_1558, partial [Acidimicrobiaceae bacterium]|nr:hypothetical protein [Acidimicrobiaceae bacterium]
ATGGSLEHACRILAGRGAGHITAVVVLAADNVKRVFWPPGPPDDEDWSADPQLARLRAFVETKTVWHPMGV